MVSTFSPRCVHLFEIPYNFQEIAALYLTKVLSIFRGNISLFVLFYRQILFLLLQYKCYCHCSITVPLDEENTIIVEAPQGQETIISLDENSPYYYNRLSAEEIHGACSILEYMINANIKYETIYDIRSAHQENDIKKELIKKTRCELVK